MAAEKLFGNGIKPACKYCEEAFSRLDDDKVMCMKRGIVSTDYSCRKFRYNPLLRVPPRPLALEKLEKAEFEL